MKSIHGQRVYQTYRNAHFLYDEFNMEATGRCEECGEGCGAEIEVKGNVDILKAGDKTLAIVLDKKWADELEEFLTNWHKREDNYKKQIVALCDEINQLKADKNEKQESTPIHGHQHS